jgi:alkylation response protein AidB-like acyl-CoA dehydrogenase
LPAPRGRRLRTRNNMNQELQNTLTLLAGDLHAGARDVSCITPQFGAMGLLRLGLSDALGGRGAFWQAVRAIADVARLSLTGAFFPWGQRAVIELVAQGASAWLHRQVLPELLQGTLAAAPGLSNAMKSLSGIEDFQLQAEHGAKGISIRGRLPWVSNLQPDGFVVAAVARTATGRPVAFLAPATAAGLARSDYFELMGLQGSATAAVTFAQVTLEEQWLLHADARLLLPRIRPAFLLLQCGLPLGLGQRALAVAQAALGAGHLLQRRLDTLQSRWRELEAKCRWLCARKEDPSLAPQLFRLRIDLTQLAVDAVFIELQAVGGRAFAAGSETSRHVSEAAFLPLVTPTVAHLEAELQNYSRNAK